MLGNVVLAICDRLPTTINKKISKRFTDRQNNTYEFIALGTLTR